VSHAASESQHIADQIESIYQSTAAVPRTVKFGFATSQTKRNLLLLAGSSLSSLEVFEDLFWGRGEQPLSSLSDRKFVAIDSKLV
jgi:hypothetical protein